MIDHAQSRLKSLRTSIDVNRGTVVLCCFLWIALVNYKNPDDSLSLTLYTATSPGARRALFAVIVVLGIIERLSGIANMLTMERDWVPAVADVTEAEAGGGAETYTLTKLNATMRRIDLICKLFAPLFISAIVEATSPAAGVLLIGFVNVISIAVEKWFAGRVWNTCARLRAPKSMTGDITARTSPSSASSGIIESAKVFLVTQYGQMEAYFSTTAWIPSLSLALLYLSALSYAATFVTWLLNSGFSLTTITIARAFGSVVEVSSTFLAPVGIRKLARPKGDQEVTLRQRDDTLSRQGLMHQEDENGHTDVIHTQHMEQDHLIGLARSGLWAVTMQFISLVSLSARHCPVHSLTLSTQIPVVLAILTISNPSPLPDQDNKALRLLLRSLPGPSLVTATVLFTFLSLSRLGLWTFDLCVQELDQILVPAGSRSSFAGTETAFTSLFELGQWVLVAVLSSPTQFIWVALVSLASVGISVVAYAGWHWRLRGHLVHWEKMCTR